MSKGETILRFCRLYRLMIWIDIDIRYKGQNILYLWLLLLLLWSVVVAVVVRCCCLSHSNVLPSHLLELCSVFSVHGQEVHDSWAVVRLLLAWVSFPRGNIYLVRVKADLSLRFLCVLSSSWSWPTRQESLPVIWYCFSALAQVWTHVCGHCLCATFLRM